MLISLSGAGCKLSPAFSLQLRPNPILSTAWLLIFRLNPELSYQLLWVSIVPPAAPLSLPNRMCNVLSLAYSIGLNIEISSCLCCSLRAILILMCGTIPTTPFTSYMWPGLIHLYWRMTVDHCRL